MKSLSTHIIESFDKSSIKILYHFSYDINSSEEYQKSKSKLDKIIEDTNPQLNEDICGSTKILGYEDLNFNLFEVLENKLSEKITYCLSVVSIKTENFEVATNLERALKL